MTGPARVKTGSYTVAPGPGEVNPPDDYDLLYHRLRRISGLTDNQRTSLAQSLDPDLVEQVSDAVLAQMVSGTLPTQALHPGAGMPLGLPGAQSDSRYVGGTDSGPPTTGDYHARDFVIAADGHLWICTVSGTPGTWVNVALADVVANTPDASTSVKGLVKLAGDLAGTAASPTVPGLAAKADATATATALAGKAAALAPTAVRTTSYTAAANDIVPVDTTSGAVTVTLPTAPADGTRVTVKHVVQGGTNTVTIARGGGSDVFNKTGGSTSLSLSTLNQAMTVQYQASSHIWYVVNDSLTPAAVVALGTGTFAPLPAAAQNPLTGLFHPEGFGAVGNGTTDDTAALQAAHDAIDAAQGGTIWLSSARRYNFSALNITKPRVTIDGPGRLYNGTVYIGVQSGYAPVEMFTKIRCSFDRATRSTTADAVVVANSRQVDLAGGSVNGYRALLSFPALALGGSNDQHSARIRVTGWSTPYWWDSATNVAPIDHLVYVNGITSGGAFAVGDLTVASNPSVVCQIAHLRGTGGAASTGQVDGLVVTGNTFFFPGYQRALTNKVSHIWFDGACDWVNITGNQLFEAGYESINMTDPRNFTITGNNIAWAGQRDLKDAIALTINSGTFARGTVSGNNLQLYTKAAVAIYGSGDASGVTVGPNSALATNPNAFYYGATSLPTSFSRYTAASGLSNLPRVVEATGSYAGTTTNDVIGTATLESGMRLGNRSFLMSRGKTVTVSAANTVVGGFSSASGSTSAYGGLLVVFADGGSNHSAQYVIAVGGAGGAPVLTTISSSGETTGAGATAPSFTFSTNSSNQLLATPVGSSSGSFTFFVTALGNLRFS